MKHLFASVILLFAFSAVADRVTAQTARDRIDLTRQEIQTERQAITAANLQLSEAEGKTFWPIYREYRQEVAILGDRLVKLIEEYAANYKTLTNEQASAMLDESLSVQQDENKIMTRYINKMQQNLPAKTVARFFQIENQLNHILRAQVADQIPLVRNK